MTRLAQVPQYGGALHVSPSVTCVLAQNPSPMTGRGTNSYVITDGSGRTLVVDPGPLIDEHHVALESLGSPQTILLSHSHFDHSESAPLLAEKWGVPVYAMDGSCVRDTQPLGHGQLIEHGELRIRVLHTPGHTPDSVSFAVDADRVLLSGDTVLGDGSTALLHPEGRLDDYFRTLESLEQMEGWILAPGHGAIGADVSREALERAAHRHERLSQVREQADALGFELSQLDPRVMTEPDFEQLFVHIYPELEGMRARAARSTLRAQLEYLVQDS